MLADARKVKNLPGRPKRDPSDSAWLAVCFERGAVTSCFVPTPEFRLIRLHTRYRRDLIDERTREKNRTENHSWTTSATAHRRPSRNSTAPS